MSLLFKGNDWTFADLERMLEVSEQIGTQDLGMKLYPNQLEVISADQMLDAYSSVGMPIMYNHWSFGKRLVGDTARYKKGHMGLALEIVINTNPSIAYLMEDNSAIMQLLVIAHASVGHNFCFANNYMFRDWTDADSIIDYLNFAKNYIRMCEEKYGIDEVERIMDSCHALQNLGVDKYRRAKKLNARQEADRQKERMAEWERTQTEFWMRMDPNTHKNRPQERQLLEEPEENLLYFIEKNSPVLKPWQRELVRIVRKISQYWYPQRQTKVLNEGIATFTHYYILNKLYDENQISDAHMMEWLSSHANVVYQPAYDHKRYSGINPYALGYAIFRDIRRMCENPTEEDRRWFPRLPGADWRAVVREAATEYRDDSFVMQWLSPRVAREMKLFSIEDDHAKDSIKVDAIHNPETFAQLRTNLGNSYDINSLEPNILVVEADLKGDRKLVLEHRRVNDRLLNTNTDVMLEHLRRLWGYQVILRSVSAAGTTLQTFRSSL